MYFYELHEGDDEVFADLILVHADEIAPEDFYELVQAARRRVQDSFEQDTLIEAIAEELERDHGFLFVSDRRLTAAVNVSTEDEENFLARTGEAEGDDDAFEEDDEDEPTGDYRTIVADLRRD